MTRSPIAAARSWAPPWPRWPSASAPSPPPLPPAAAGRQPRAPRRRSICRSTTGKLVRLPAPMSDLFIANDQIADVQVRSPTQFYVFGKSARRDHGLCHRQVGPRVYAANVRVGSNLGSVDQMLHLAMPEAIIQATPMGNMVLLTGTVASPEDATRRAPGDGFRRRRRAGRQSPEVGDPAAGQPARPHRRSQPQRRQADRRQPAQPRHDERLPVRHRPAAAGIFGRLPPQTRRPASRASTSTTSRAAPRSAPPASCSASTSSARSILPKATAW